VSQGIVDDARRSPRTKCSTSVMRTSAGNRWRSYAVGERSPVCVASQGVATLLAAASGLGNVWRQRCLLGAAMSPRGSNVSGNATNDAASRKRCGNAGEGRRHANVPEGSVTLQNLVTRLPRAAPKKAVRGEASGPGRWSERKRGRVKDASGPTRRRERSRAAAEEA
jgi:hypothetical protein